MLKLTAIKLIITVVKEMPYFRYKLLAEVIFR